MKKHAFLCRGMVSAILLGLFFTACGCKEKPEEKLGDDGSAVVVGQPGNLPEDGQEIDIPDVERDFPEPMVTSSGPGEKAHDYKIGLDVDERIVLTHSTDTCDKENVYTEAARGFDDGRTERNREVPLPGLGLFVIGVFYLDWACVAESFIQIGKSCCIACLVETCFVIGLADIGTDCNVIIKVVIAAHVHADGKAIERS